ncbi:unnamed protein product [Aphanomyces euteiches]|uniref:EamA domain-containing protein n=1 Tax=Aphanomyces euteiches TaxID=100861 RepID=A0A6G0WYW2_9STRA|nr:hypothetical protein Ae201684_010392 [Aphanomyces euteiches]KAH9090348.1 hypothetical protein Ae201684P_014154 [Aphanomyces euteiches]KAH9153363.1 hypothetical protein AeRB84_004370 [Aphanomyces euteiches]
MDIKVVSFVLLVLQNALGTIVIKYSRATKYHGTTTIFLYETLKLILCLAVVLISKRGNVWDTIRTVRIEVLGDTQGYLKMVLLATLYSVQNNVQLLALDHVSASTYAIVYQLKIVSTAFFMMVLLKRTFHLVQWVAMFGLMFGVVICSMGNAKRSSDGKTSNALGLLMVIGLAINSGVAAAYFESVLKTHKPKTATHDHAPMDSMWKTNIQLASVSVLVALVGVCHTAATTPQFVFFEGYNGFTWGVVWLQACGGLIVSAVVRYSDNVVKNFGTAFSLVLGCLLSNYLFDDRLTSLFYIGIALVVLSVYVYGDSRLHGSKTEINQKKTVEEHDVSMTPQEDTAQGLMGHRNHQLHARSS